MTTTTPKTVLVLGAYGFIGAACAAALSQAGFAVRGAGRDAGQAARSPIRDWVIGDLTRFCDDDWDQALAGVDAVVNAVGALQDGATDRVRAVHVDLVRGMGAAARRAGCRLVQISALGARTDAGTPFLATKGEADDLISRAGGDHVILRPGLVLGQQAYGGTALLRMVAAQPLVGFVALPRAQIQIIGMDDLADIVVAAVQGGIGSGAVMDLYADETHDLLEVTCAVRDWLGFAPWRRVLPVPGNIAMGLAKLGDLLGWLGWRPALRTTSLAVLRDGIVAQGAGSPAVTGKAGIRINGLSQTLATLSPAPGARLQARLSLLLPVAVSVLSLFWVLSGFVGVIRFDAAQQVLTDAGHPPILSGWAVALGSVADIGLGLGLLVRRYAVRAALGMAGLGLVYLLGGSFLTPGLWADPMGPFLKVVPGILTALFVAAMLGDQR